MGATRTPRERNAPRCRTVHPGHPVVPQSLWFPACRCTYFTMTLHAHGAAISEHVRHVISEYLPTSMHTHTHTHNQTHTCTHSHTRTITTIHLIHRRHHTY